MTQIDLLLGDMEDHGYVFLTKRSLLNNLFEYASQVLENVDMPVKGNGKLVERIVGNCIARMYSNLDELLIFDKHTYDSVFSNRSIQKVAKDTCEQAIYAATH